MAKEGHMSELIILRVLVGSRAYGLERPDSDYDYREVVAYPTSEVLSLGGVQKEESWDLGRVAPRQDETAYELRHFLDLACHSNPSILEVFRAPVEEEHSEYGPRLRDLMQYVWEPKRVADAFGGYSKNQRKKFLENKDGRRWKYAVAYLRVLYQGIDLLLTGDFHLPLNRGRTDFLRRVGLGAVSMGDVVEAAEKHREALELLSEQHAKKSKDLGPVNEFLLDVRKNHW